MMISSINNNKLAYDISNEPTDLKSACKVMEQQFANMLFSSMRKSMVPASESKGHIGFAKDTAYSMFDTQMAQSVTEGEGMGLWKMLYDQMSSAEIKSEQKGAEESNTGLDSINFKAMR
jgi:Rod binding domain-containing protein